MAPNLITLAGLSLNFVTMGVFLASDTAYKETFPFWAYALMAFTVLGYQTLDAVDGKQARRTNTSSPLGQLFDHGCDAMSTSIVFSFMYQGLLLGRESDLSGWLLIYIPTHVSHRISCRISRLTTNLSQIIFYLAQWEEQHTGIMLTNFMGAFGTTEGKCCLLDLPLILLATFHYVVLFFSPLVADHLSLFRTL